MREVNGELFARSKKYSKLSPFELNSEGGRGKALVLRYAGCNLRCPLCYAWKYAWFPRERGYFYKTEEVFKVLERLESDKKINWMRIQGGEPCISLNRTILTIKIASKGLRAIEEKGLNNYSVTRAIIQTNGIFFSTLNQKGLESIRKALEEEAPSIGNGRIIFEFSFKDPTGSWKLHTKGSILSLQAEGFNKMLKHVFKPLWREGIDNVALYVIAGLGPSIDLDNSYIVPIERSFKEKELPKFHPKTWSEKFEALYSNFLNNVVQGNPVYHSYISNKRTGNGTKIPLEEFEPNWFQTSWITGYSGKYKEWGIPLGDIPSLGEILRRLSNKIDKQWLALCKGKGGIIKERLQVLKSIPLAKDSEEMVRLIKEMNEKFYPSHPKNHYPNL